MSKSLQPMDCSMPGFSVHHQLLELAQTHVHWVSDAIQASYPLSSPSPTAISLSQHQDLFHWVSSSHQVVKVWLLCPWDSLGKNTGVDCHAVLQGIFPTQGSNPHVLSPTMAGRFFTISSSWEAQSDLQFSSVHFSSVAQSCPTLCNPMNHSTPGLPVHHQLLEFTQTHVS